MIATLLIWGLLSVVTVPPLLCAGIVVGLEDARRARKARAT